MPDCTEDEIAQQSAKLSQAGEARRAALAAASGGGGGGSLQVLCGGASAMCRGRRGEEAYDVEALRGPCPRAVGEGCPHRLPGRLHAAARAGRAGNPDPALAPVGAVPRGRARGPPHPDPHAAPVTRTRAFGCLLPPRTLHARAHTHTCIYTAKFEHERRALTSPLFA